MQGGTVGWNQSKRGRKVEVEKEKVEKNEKKSCGESMHFLNSHAGVDQTHLHFESAESKEWGDGMDI